MHASALGGYPVMYEIQRLSCRIGAPASPGRPSKKGPTAGGAPRLDRRERPADGPVGPPHVGAAGPDAAPGPARRRDPPEGLRQRRVVAVPAAGSPGAVLPDPGQRVL